MASTIRVLSAVEERQAFESLHAALLDLEVSGTPGDALYWVDVSVEKQ